MDITPLSEQRSKTLAAVREIRRAVDDALRAEIREGQASAEGSDRWDWLNNLKWSLYEDAVRLVPNGEAALAKGEDALLDLLHEYSDMSAYQIARKAGLPW